MANQGVTAAPDPHYFGKTYQFDRVFEQEKDLINKRRAENGRDPVELEDETPPQFNADAERVLRPTDASNVVGLALSGGGIRSAAFCLGALQALDKAEVLQQVDYLSTVSGGGYIGCSLTACLEESEAPWRFPYSSNLREDEPPPLQQLRNYSNYLFPHGLVDFLYNAPIYLRGLIVNAVLVTAVASFAAALTLTYLWLRGGEIAKNLSFLHFTGVPHFYLTIDLALLLPVVGILWAMFQSRSDRIGETRVYGWGDRILQWLVMAILIAALCELQIYVLDKMMEGTSGSAAVTVANWIHRVVIVLTPVGAALAFVASKLGEYVKSTTQSPSGAAQARGIAVTAAIYLGGLIIPALLWLFYLDVSYWGDCIDSNSALFAVESPTHPSCTAPIWLAHIAQRLFGASACTMIWFYGVVALVCLALSLFMRPNANSLHPLYRARLAKAFMFEPLKQVTLVDLPELHPNPRLSTISFDRGPYHLINTALNIQASRTANRRGRNADFFMLSKFFVGSKATGYVRTPDIEDVDLGLDLATAMAVSGAAASSNMGSQTIKPLTATLALLNIRLGYWMRNPKKLADAARYESRMGMVLNVMRRRNVLANFYFLAELFGKLTEDRKSVYLTDGGHIENLGVYELLRRRCKVIIAIDAEADPQMAFASFNTLERYALIDLGVRIDLPWQAIADISLTTGKAIDNNNNAPKNDGPHCAIGEITYPGDRKGVLIYIKASLTGDENDYVFDYKKRYSAFPHETTLDQMFTEEQFEAYRALGFHAAYRLFDRSDSFAHLDPANRPAYRAAIDYLDNRFPRAAADGPPLQRPTFADWL